MADALILEFEGFGRETYERVNDLLGIDPESGEGDWPRGLLFHSGAAKPGGFVVFEIWDSKTAQEAFMAERLGRALQDGGVGGPPARLEWLEVAAYHDLEG
jgi:hypothetical protein